MGKAEYLIRLQSVFLIFLLSSIIENVLQMTQFQEIGFVKCVKCQGKDNSWEPWENVHALDIIAEFYWKHLGVARHIWSAEFFSLPFQPTIMPRHHDSEGGGWMLEDITVRLLPFPLFPPSPIIPILPPLPPDMSPHTDDGQTTALCQELYHNRTDVSIPFLFYLLTLIQLSSYQTTLFIYYFC